MKQGDNLTILVSIDGGTAASEIACSMLLAEWQKSQEGDWSGRRCAGRAGVRYR
jgi:hypothetical protein